MNVASNLAGIVARNEIISPGADGGSFDFGDTMTASSMTSSTF